jgi:hypothetical protein
MSKQAKLLNYLKTGAEVTARQIHGLHLQQQSNPT